MKYFRAKNTAYSFSRLICSVALRSSTVREASVVANSQWEGKTPRSNPAFSLRRFKACIQWWEITISQWWCLLGSSHTLLFHNCSGQRRSKPREITVEVVNIPTSHSTSLYCKDTPGEREPIVAECVSHVPETGRQTLGGNSRSFLWTYWSVLESESSFTSSQKNCRSQK